MAEYKRLITYAYNYEAGTKKHNVGYARVEVIGNELKMKFDLKVPSLSGKLLKLYFYKRIRGGIHAVYFGELPVTNGLISERLTSNSENVQDSGLNFDELNGFILYYNTTKCIVSDWKDRSLSREELACIEDPITKWVSKEILAVPSVEKRIEEVIIEVEPTKEEATKEEPNLSEVESQLPEAMLVQKTDQVREVPVQEANQVPEVPVKEVDQIPEVPVPEVPVQEANQIPEVPVPEVSVKEADLSSIVPPEIKKDAELKIDTGIFQKPEVEAANLNEVKAEDETITATSMQQTKERSEANFPWRDAPAAKHILSNFPRVYPFEDGEIAECVKIEPKDIGLLPMESWGIGNNSFLIHAHYNYHHLLFAKKQTRGGCLYLLMVPGIYNPREKYMARMFGFEYFKCAKRRNTKDGEFGYWYVTINFGS